MDNELQHIGPIWPLVYIWFPITLLVCTQLLLLPQMGTYPCTMGYCLRGPLYAFRHFTLSLHKT